MKNKNREQKDKIKKTNNFLRQIIENDLNNTKYENRFWGGSPGDKSHHENGILDSAKLRTRFPPEPNGFLHIGHAKSICVNFGLAKEFKGICHLRFDDTNPAKEEQIYVDAIKEAVRWLGFDYQEHLYFASDYFDFMYRSAVYLIEQNLAYVDEQSFEEIKQNRGSFHVAGIESPFRNRSIEENLKLFEGMKAGKITEGKAVLRAKIDMASPNINLRDPTIYRIRFASHHNTGDKWCIYPMYSFAHPIEDALEHITHSICTLEFEDQRPFYNWVVDNLAKGGLIAEPTPRQYEFSRLNLTYVVTSKRKLKHLVDNKIVNGWDDPRMPTILGLKRRGFTPESIRNFCKKIGITKDYAWIDYSLLENCLREDLETKAPRKMAVLNPLLLEITNWAEIFGSESHVENCQLSLLPNSEIKREFTFSRQVWIDKEDFSENPPAGYKRLFVGNKVRLKGAFVVECSGFEKNKENKIIKVLAKIIPDTKSGTTGANLVKVKSAITWVDCQDNLEAEFRLYDRLFLDEKPDSGDKDFLNLLNPESLKVVHGFVEPTLKNYQLNEKFQFERFGYFVTDLKDNKKNENNKKEKLVFNRIVELKHK